MSSGYKIKGHQRSRSAKPYDRKAGLVNRVKEWLTPSSWLGSWSKDGSGQADAASPAHLNSQRLASPLEMAGASSSSPQTSSAFVPRPGALANPFLSNPQALLGGSRSVAGPSSTLDGVLPPPSTSAVGGGIAGLSSASIVSHSGSNMETRLRSLLAIPRSLRSGVSSSGVPSRPELMEEISQEDLDTSKDSEGSWIAEDDGSIKERMEQRSSQTEGQRSVRLRTNHLPPLNLSDMEERSDEYTYDLGEGHASVVQPTSQLTPVTKRAEQVILQVENPVAKPPPPPRMSSVDSGQTSLSSSILNRLYTTNPFAMSTPQLSPVHETREEESHRDNGAAKSPVSSSEVGRSQFHTQSSMLTVAARDRSLPLSSISTPSKLHTEESLRRSPFRSPFYSGRTSFGGAASGQKPRIKRPRTESSPPVFAPLRLSVMARPVSSASKGGPLVASQTAKKIMESLGSLSSPLASARKLPMRALPGELQVAKRRRVSLDSEAAGTSGGGGRVLSPPPIAPLRTPSHPSRANSGPLIVPNEKSAQSRRHEAPSLRDRNKSNTGGIDFKPENRSSEQSSIGKVAQPTDRGKDKARGDSSAAPNETPPTIFSSLFPSSTSSSLGSSSSSKPMFTVPNFSSTAPPKPSSILSGLTFTAPPCSVKPADGPEEWRHDRSPPGAADDDDNRNFSRGGGKMRSVRRSRRGAEQEESFEEDTGYVNPMAPPPAVGLSLGKGGSLPKFIFHTQLAPTSKSQDSSQSSSATQATHLTSSPAFSFSVPKSINSESASTKTTGEPSKLEASFNFSAPKDHSPATTLPPLPPNSSLLQGSFKPSPFLTFSTNSSSTPASLPRMSLFTNPSSNLNSFAKPAEKPKSTPPPPPLKNMSVEEALKNPEFQLPVTKTTVNIGSVVKQKVEVCIDLTDSDDEKETKEMSKSSTSSALVAGSVTGGLQLGCSGGLKLGTPGGLKLGGAHGTTGMSTTTGKLGVAVTVGDSSGASTSLLKTDSKSSVKPLTSLAQFAPPADSWACPQCLVNNQAKDDMCVACSAKKPSSQTESKSGKVSLGSLSQFAAPPGAWECGQCLVRNKSEDDKCVACSSLKPSTLSSKTNPKIGSSSVPVFKPLSQFAPPSGSWECGQCLVSNKATDKTCVACSAARPSSAASSAESQPVNFKSKEVPKGLMLGGQVTSGGWSCDTCLVQNKATDTKCVACTTAKPGAMTTAVAAPPTSGGKSWTCDTCFVVNKTEDAKCIACSALKPDNKQSAPPPNFLSGFAPPTSSWTCDTCLVQNKAEDSTCVACTTPKPGSKPSETGGSKPTTTSSLTMGSSGGIKLGGGLSLAGFKPLGSLGKGLQDASATSTTSGGIKIGVSLSTALQPNSDKTSADSKASSSGSSAPVFGLPQASSGQSTIAQLPEKNPLAGIKFGVSAPPPTTAAASTQNPLGGIKFGIPSTTTTAVTAPSTTAPSLQFNLGSTSTAASSSPFKFGSLASGSSDKQPLGLKLGGGGGGGESMSSSMDTQMPGAQAAAPKLTVGGLGQTTTSQSLLIGSGLFGSGAQPSTASTAVNPLAGIKFGVPPPSQPSLLTSSAPSKQLQFPNQLQFGSTATSSAGSTSSSGLSFNFSATTSTATTSSGLGSGSTASPFVFSGAKSSGTGGQPAIQFGVPISTQQPGGGLNAMLNTSSTSEKPSSSLFVFSGSKDTTKIGTSSPFPTAGSAGGSASGSAMGGMGGASALGGGASGLGGGAQPLKLNFGTTQPSSNQPFQFGLNSGASGSIFGKPAETAVSQQGGLTLTGQQPASGLMMPQSQGSIFGGASQPPQSQPQAAGFGQSFNFSSQAPTLPGGSGLGLGGASTNFPPSSGGLNFGASSSQGVGLGGATQASATQPAANAQGYQFNPSASINLNFGVGGGSAAAPQGRIIKKARRRK